MSSREERQQEQLRQNQEQAAIAERAANQPGGGINQPQNAAPRGGPTWADTPAGRALREQYEKSGVVFDSRGNIIYNPADLGAAEIERAQAAAGMPPSSTTRGEISPQYAARVYSESKQRVKATRSAVETLGKERANTARQVKELESAIEQQKVQRAALSTVSDPQQRTRLYDNLSRDIMSNQRLLGEYQTKLGNIDAARSTLAQQERQAQKAQTRSTISLMSSRASTGPVNISNVRKDVTPTKAAPQSPRAQAQTGVRDKLFANPNFMQNAEDYTRPNLEALQTRKERPRAQQGSQDSVFANPNFVRYESEPATPLEALAGFAKAVAPRRDGKAFAVSLAEGAPAPPRELTQDQVNLMSPQEYAAYRAEYESYNKYVLQSKEESKRQRAENLANWKESKQSLLTSISEAKKAGYTTFSIKDEKGTRGVPIDKAFKEIVSSRGLIGAAPVPIIPADYSVAGSISEPVLISERGTLIGPVKPEIGIKKDSGGAIGFLEGVAAPAVNLGKLLGSLPEGLSKELSAGSYTKAKEAGEEVLAKQKLQPTVVDTLITGKPTGMSREYDIGTAVGEAAIFFAPTAASKIKIRVPSFAKTETPKPQKEIIGEPQGIKAYPKSKLRSQGYEGLPELKTSFVPREELTIRKAFEIPRAPTSDITTTGPRLAQRPKDILQQMGKERQIKRTTPTPPEPEPFITQKIGLGRGTAEFTPKQTVGPFPKGTTTFESTIGKPVKEVEGFTPEKPPRDVFLKDVFKEESVGLGAGVLRPISRFTGKKINIGKSRSTIISQRLGRGQITTIKTKPVEPVRFTSERVELGRATKGLSITGIPLGRGTGVLPTPPKYGPFPKGTTTFESTIGKPVKEVEGFTPEKPPRDVFLKDVFKEESVGLGKGTATSFGTRFKPSPRLSRISLGKADSFFIGKGGVKSTRPWKPFRPDETTRTSRYVTLLEKPTPAPKFVATSIALGTSKTKVVKAATATGATAAPAPFIGKVAAESATDGNFIINQTGNQSAPPVQGGDLIITEEPTSELEPLSISERRSTIAAISQGGAVGTDVLPRLRSGLVSRQRERQITRERTRQIIPQAIRVSISTKQKQPLKQTERFKPLYPTPLRNIPRLIQPEALKPKQLLRLRSPPPKKPKKPIVPFAWPTRKQSKKKREIEEKDRADFLGQALVSDVIGFGRRGDITYGRSLTAKLAGRDVRQSGKRYGSFANTKTERLLKRERPNPTKKFKPERVIRL